jgi:hypothetical protein
MLQNAVAENLVVRAPRKGQESRVGDNELRFNPQLLCYAARGEHGPEIWIDSSHLISLSRGSDCPPSPVAADIKQPFPESARQANLRDRIGSQTANEFLV